MRTFILSAIVSLLTSVPASAQNTPKAEVYEGDASFVLDAGVEQVLHGWNTSVDGNIKDAKRLCNRAAGRFCVSAFSL